MKKYKDFDPIKKTDLSLSYEIVQKGTLFITPEKGMIDNRPTCSVLRFEKKNLFSSERWNVLIDIDHPAKNPDDIVNSLASIGLKPEQIDVIILTHLHPDHIGHKDIFPNAHFIFHRDERLSFYFKENRTFELESSVIWKIMENRLPEVIDYKPEFKELNNNLFIKHCPGHTKGSLVVFANIDNLVHAFVGGTFLNQDYYNRWEPPGMSWEKERIYEHMSFIKENADVIIPGHGEPFRIMK